MRHRRGGDTAARLVCQGLPVFPPRLHQPPEHRRLRVGGSADDAGGALADLLAARLHLFHQPRAQLRAGGHCLAEGREAEEADGDREPEALRHQRELPRHLAELIPREAEARHDGADDLEGEELDLVVPPLHLAGLGPLAAVAIGEGLPSVGRRPSDQCAALIVCWRSSFLGSRLNLREIAIHFARREGRQHHPARPGGGSFSITKRCKGCVQFMTHRFSSPWRGSSRSPEEHKRMRQRQRSAALAGQRARATRAKIGLSKDELEVRRIAHAEVFLGRARAGTDSRVPRCRLPPWI